MGTKRRFSVFTLAFAYVVALAACSPTTTGDECVATSDCRHGWNCVGGVCRQVCNDTPDCDELDFRCELGVCLPTAGYECDTAADCTAPNACQLRADAACADSSCIYLPVPCTTPPEHLCIDGGNTFRTYGHTGTCVLGTGGCEYPTFDTACPSCASTCLPACTPLDCADWECVTNGRCQPGPPAICIHDDIADDTTCVQGTGIEGACLDGNCLPAGEISCLSNPPCLETCLGGWCRPRSPPGWPCDPGDDDDCVADLTCVDSRCRAANGATCTDNDGCLEVCINDVCAPRSMATGPCDHDDDNDCVAGLACASGFCFVTSGGDCNFNDDCAGTCIDLVCSPVSALGGPCDANDDDDCSGAAGCFTGVCRLTDGASCGTNEDCANTCIAAVCAALAPPESHCDDPADCDTTAGAATCQGGVCRLQTGGICDSNSQCLDTCIEEECASVSQILGTCDDADDCEDTLECASQQCRYPDGTTCDNDTECSSTHCECTTSACTPRVCAAVDCDCGYGADGTCGSQLPTGTDDLGDCDTPGMTCHTGSCRAESSGSCGCACGSNQSNCSPAHVSSNSCGTGWTATCNAGGCLWFTFGSGICLTLDPPPTCDCDPT